jgi:hypothetical protein
MTNDQIIVNGKSFRIHPIYDMYGGSEDGDIMHIVKQDPTCGGKNGNGYLSVGVRSRSGKRRKTCKSHRFIWECYNGMIRRNMVIDHINDERDDNRLSNLQMVDNKHNCRKSAKNRDYSFAAKNHENRKCVRAVNYNDDTESFYNSLHAVNQHLGINAGIVKMVCEGLNGCKSGISKVDGCKYTFNYISKEELPEDHKKSANIRPRRIK